MSVYFFVTAIRSDFDLLLAKAVKPPNEACYSFHKTQMPVLDFLECFGVLISQYGIFFHESFFEAANNRLHLS